MATYLVTWNPKLWFWDLDADRASIAKRGYLDDRWSVGHTKRIVPGDRLFLLRQGVEPRGIMASGYATTRSYMDEHWDGKIGHFTLYVGMRFDAILDPDINPILGLDLLRHGDLGNVNWKTQTSGIFIRPEAALQLEGMWSQHCEGLGLITRMPEEVSHDRSYREGATVRIAVNAYERDRRARDACVSNFGPRCCVCGFDFGETYGPAGEGFIHVHHLVPLATIGESYQVDPLADLRPVCPNCHAMLHRGGVVRSIEELRHIMNRNPPVNGIDTDKPRV